jgi:hypothetical protein
LTALAIAFNFNQFVTVKTEICAERLKVHVAAAFFIKDFYEGKSFGEKKSGEEENYLLHFY